ncbi:MAG: undecaprenyl-diphosphate phosphatase [Candidatus Krumholzibacteriia bacterium]
MSHLVEVLALAAVQGLTEFLPVSSSGHLVLMQHFIGASPGDLFFDVVLHCGTLGSVLVVYRREVGRLLRLDAAARGYLFALALGTVPAGLVGVGLQATVERLFVSPATAGAGLLITAGLLLSTLRARAPEASRGIAWQPRPPSLSRALLIGCAQALAICPGISRSGATITAALWLGLPRDEAARFSFLLSVPAIGGALVLHLLGPQQELRTDVAGLVMSAVVAFAVGLLAIRWTALAVVQHHFWKFGPYCAALGLLVLVLV